MELSALSRVIAPTLSRQLFMMAKQYDDVIDFTLGDPDVPTPKAICDAAFDAAVNGKTHYAPNAGLPESVDGKTVYNVSPDEFAQDMREIAKLGVSILGGCCGAGLPGRF